VATGLLVASGVTLIGIWRDLTPDVILFRAAVAGLACGILASLVRLVMNEA
jgi:hypothetical protein